MRAVTAASIGSMALVLWCYFCFALLRLPNTEMSVKEKKQYPLQCITECTQQERELHGHRIAWTVFRMGSIKSG